LERTINWWVGGCAAQTLAQNKIVAVCEVKKFHFDARAAMNAIFMRLIRPFVQIIGNVCVCGAADDADRWRW
ncbi:hypothetical protein, partial [Burkholderia cenocepacia]